MSDHQADKWIEIARALPEADDPDMTAYWRPSRQRARQDAREWSSPGDVMHIQIGRVRRSDLLINAHDYVTTDESLIDWGALDVVAGLDNEELRALEALRDAEIDEEVLASVHDALRARAARRD